MLSDSTVPANVFAVFVEDQVSTVQACITAKFYLAFRSTILSTASAFHLMEQYFFWVTSQPSPTPTDQLPDQLSACSGRQVLSNLLHSVCLMKGSSPQKTFQVWGIPLSGTGTVLYFSWDVCCLQHLLWALYRALYLLFWMWSITKWPWGVYLDSNFPFLLHLYCYLGVLYQKTWELLKKPQWRLFNGKLYLGTLRCLCLWHIKTAQKKGTEYFDMHKKLINFSGSMCLKLGNNKTPCSILLKMHLKVSKSLEKCNFSPILWFSLYKSLLVFTVRQVNSLAA